MSIIDQLECRNLYPIVLRKGLKARIKQTGQIVELKRVSEHGISVVSYKTGGDYFIANNFLEPVPTLH